MSDDQPILSPEIQAAADAAKEDRTPTRLMYAEDLTAGVVVIATRRCDNPMAEVFGVEGHNHGVEERTILEVRMAGDVVSCITLDEAGEQQPMVEHRLSTVRVAAR